MSESASTHAGPASARAGGRILTAVERALGLVRRVAGMPRGWGRPRTPEQNGASAPTPNEATLEDITAAYKLLLRRSPDPDGLRHYGNRVSRGLTLDDLISSVMKSDEFRERIVPLLPGELKNRIRRQLLAEEVVAVDLGGYVVCVRPADQDFGRAIAATRDYEPHVRRFMAESIRAGQVVVDVGANVGCLAFQAARLVGERGQVIAIEPNLENVQLLYAGILMNEWTHVQVWPYAAWDSSGIMALKGGASNTYLVEPTPLAEGRVYAQLIRLDDVLASADRIDLIKIDVEGHESRVIQGARKLIEKHRPTLLTEFNPRCLQEVGGIAPVEYAEQLLSHYSRLRVITAFGDDLEFRSAAPLMAHWNRRNTELARMAILPEGMLQFDVIATRPGAG